jgi:virginiamycin B lyase
MGETVMQQPIRLVACAVACTLALPVLAQRPGRVAMPDGEGKALVESLCVSCHETNLIAGSAGYDADGWKYLASHMIALPDDTASTISRYLATHYPPSDRRQPKLVAGDTQIEIQEWFVPTLGQRPRDPFQAQDGTIWWAGMYASLIGRLDPKTGEMREYRLEAGARPHSIVEDSRGNIWYTGNGNGTVGMLDPVSGDIRVYPMPDPAARDPHTPIFNRAGHLWFTLQNSNMLGRLIPDTGAIRLITMPTADARPYGIKEDSKGMLWIAYNGSHKIAKVDPSTWQVTEFSTGTPESRIRRLALTSDDTIYYVDSARGYLGRLDPATGKITTWPSPSGPQSHPYAIEVVDDVVWYNESTQRPDTLVRFDPKTERFQSWPIPSGVGIIRHMRRTPAGDLVIHQSSTNTIGIVKIGTES